MVVQGFEADNKNILLLRLRNYTMGKKLKDEEVLGQDSLEKIARVIEIMVPFVSAHFHHLIPPTRGTPFFAGWYGRAML